MKVIFSGLESSGKSLKLAMTAAEIAHRNFKWFEKQKRDYEHLGAERFKEKYEKDAPKVRPIVSNLQFSDVFYEHVTKELGVPITYWTNLDDLIKMEHCDIFIDEVGNYFDSRLWTDLSLDARRWLTQGAKTGIEMYGTAQDFAQVDKAFRRLVNDLIHITKAFGSRRPSPTKPPVKYIWGLCMGRALDPQGYDEDKKKFAGSFAIPHFFAIRRQACEIFDTTQKIVRSKPTPYRHIEKECELPDCRALPSHKRIIHV